MTDNDMPTIHQAAQRLIVTGHLPAPYQIDPHDQRPLWDINGVSALFDRRPDELLALLMQHR